jgi:hypothetical protein
MRKWSLIDLVVEVIGGVVEMIGEIIEGIIG